MLMTLRSITQSRSVESPSSSTVRRWSLAVLCVVCWATVLACGGPEEAAVDPGSTSSSGAPGASVPAFHLVNDFSTAVVEQEMARLELGTPEARGHLVKGWGQDERDDVRTYTWGLGPASSFELLLVDVADSRLTLEGRAYDFEGASPQTVDVVVNGAEIGRLTIGADFARHPIDVAAQHLRTGSNHFELRYGRYDRPKDVVEGANDDRPLAVLWYDLELEEAVTAEAPRVQGETLQLPVGTRVSYFEELRPGDELVLGQVDVAGGGAALRVELATADGLQTWHPDAANGDGPLRWVLPLETPQLARLSLVGRRASAGVLQRLTGWWGDGPRVDVLLPMVMRAAVDEAEMAGKASTGEATPEDGESVPPDVIIYLIDTLRADHLGVYGYGRPTSPRIDRFAEGATVFTNAQAQSSWTRTGVTSLMTGMLPQAHGVNRRDEALAPEITTLAEAFKAQGYTTLGFITNGNVSATFGLDQGFNHYQYLSESKNSIAVHQTAARLNHWVFKWLDTLAPRGQRPPFFLYVHATDPHAPYTPPGVYYERFAAGVDPLRGRLEHVHGISGGRHEAPEGTAEAWKDLYDGEIAYTDHHFGRLLDKLETMDLAASSMMVLVSDHGEEFFEHGGWEHGKTLYGEQLRVPLIVQLPGREHGGQRLSILANQMDVMPTLLDYVGVELPELVQGQSLLPWIRGEAEDLSKAPSYAYLRLSGRHSESVIDRGFKLIVDSVPNPPAHLLFHVDEDVAETVDMSADRPIEGGFLGQDLRRLEESLRGRGRAATQVEIDDELRKRLEALGYVGN